MVKKKRKKLITFVSFSFNLLKNFKKNGFLCLSEKILVAKIYLVKNDIVYYREY